MLHQEELLLRPAACAILEHITPPLQLLLVFCAPPVTTLALVAQLTVDHVQQALILCLEHLYAQTVMQEQ